MRSVKSRPETVYVNMSRLVSQENANGELKIVGRFSPGRKEKLTNDPATSVPHEGPDFEVEYVYLEGNDIEGILDPKVLERLASIAIGEIIGGLNGTW